MDMHDYGYVCTRKNVNCVPISLTIRLLLLQLRHHILHRVIYKISQKPVC